MAHLNMKQADMVKVAFEGLVTTNPDAAIAFLVGAGSTEEEARDEVLKVQASIKHAEKKEDLKGFLEDVKLALVDAILPGVDVDVVRVKAEVIFTRDEDTGEGSWEVSDPRLWLEGEDRAMSGKGRATGSGKSKVPVPQSLIDAGVTSWKAHAEANYPDMVLEGRSAPRELERVKDETYLAAKEAASS